MAQTGYTPIQLYYSSTPTNTPLAANLAAGELAINTADGKLFYKDSGGVVQTLAAKLALTTNGGTGLSSYTAGDMLYYASGTALSKLAIGTNGQILTISGGVPAWSAAPATGVTTISFGSTGLTPSTATSGAVSVAGTLIVANGGTGATSFTSGSLLKGAGTGAIAVASAADIVSAIGTTAVTNATNSTAITNSGGWSVTPSGTNLYFNYNGTNVGVLDSSGNLSVLGNVTAYATGPL